MKGESDNLRRKEWFAKNKHDVSSKKEEEIVSATQPVAWKQKRQVRREARSRAAQVKAGPGTSRAEVVRERDGFSRGGGVCAAAKV